MKKLTLLCNTLCSGLSVQYVYSVTVGFIYWLILGYIGSKNKVGLLGDGDESCTFLGRFAFRLYFFRITKNSTVIIKIKNTRIHSGTTTSIDTMLLLELSVIIMACEFYIPSSNYTNLIPLLLMIVAVALLGSRWTLGGNNVSLAVLSSPENVSGGSEIPSSMIWIDTVWTKSPVKLRNLDVLI